MISYELKEDGTVHTEFNVEHARICRKHRRAASTFATVWASYIFIFLAVLFTFTVVFAVGYLINSMSLDGSKASAAKMFSPTRYQTFNERSVNIMQRVRDIIARTNTTKDPQIDDVVYDKSKLSAYAETWLNTNH
uniref:SEA domain-containing protein n=1 Tax=Panagrellus redivivus TaxID=6233 RepID=A0A7E4ZZS7_PANRE